MGDIQNMYLRYIYLINFTIIMNMIINIVMLYMYVHCSVRKIVYMCVIYILFYLHTSLFVLKLSSFHPLIVAAFD